MKKPRAKIGDVVVVNLHGTITQEPIVSALYYKEWCYNQKSSRLADGYPSTTIFDKDILQNLTTNKTYE